MHLSGQLKDWSISDLLQIMQVTHKTGSLDIEGEKRGRVHFREGMVTGAELTGASTTYVGNNRGGIADVLYVLAGLTQGTFSVGAADGPDTEGWSVEQVIDDIGALQALETEVANAGLIEAPGVKLVEEIDRTVELTPGDWSVLVSLVQPFSFAQLESTLGRGAAVRILFTLHRLGVSEPLAQRESESGFFDKLADQIAPEPDRPTWRETAASEQPAPASAPAEPAAAADEPAPAAAEPPSARPRRIPQPPAADSEDSENADGVAAPASTMLTDGVYDEIRRLRSKVGES
ncbi:MAG: DUF4388 domain-containing protein [Acidimicrobiia bacterium]|nr:DUF4388 domain-containing protein [Acidimicrobiia bacterium]